MANEESLQQVIIRLDRIEAALSVLTMRELAKEWYTTEELAALVGKAEFTVREWCRLGRIHAEKRMSGRGAFPAWVISHLEHLRYQREGLLPVQRSPQSTLAGRLGKPHLA